MMTKLQVRVRLSPRPRRHGAIHSHGAAPANPLLPRGPPGSVPRFGAVWGLPAGRRGRRSRGWRGAGGGGDDGGRRRCCAAGRTGSAVRSAGWAGWAGRESIVCWNRSALPQVVGWFGRRFSQGICWRPAPPPRSFSPPSRPPPARRPISRTPWSVRVAADPPSRTARRKAVTSTVAVTIVAGDRWCAVPRGSSWQQMMIPLAPPVPTPGVIPRWVRASCHEVSVPCPATQR